MECMYNWDKFPEVIPYLKKINRNTLKYLKDNNYSLDYAKEFTEDIEDFLYYFKIKNYNVDTILDKIKDIDVIEFYEALYISNTTTDSNIPPVLNREIKILLSTYITSNNRLTSKERRRLYLYLGLSKSIISLKSNKTLLFSKFYNRYLTSNIGEVVVSNGWLLLEDTLASEMAEKITYQVLGKVRPNYHRGLDNEIYPIDENKIFSNLEIYRMFQEIVTNFGLTIKMINNSYKYNVKSTLDDIVKYSINNSFSDLVMAEYINKDRTLELYQLLYLMGLLLNEKYKEYNINFINNNLTKEEVTKIYDSVLKLTSSLINNKETSGIDYSNVIVLYDNETKEKVRKLIQNNEI